MRWFQDCSLRAGPRASLAASNTSAAPPWRADAASPGTAGSDRAGTPCRARSTANAHSIANAATASLPAGTHYCNTAPAAGSGGTSTRSPSEGNVGGANTASRDGTLGRHHSGPGTWGLVPLGNSRDGLLSTPRRPIDPSPPAHPADRTERLVYGLGIMNLIGYSRPDTIFAACRQQWSKSRISLTSRRLSQVSGRSGRCSSTR